MTGTQVFVVLWGVGAVLLGSLFAFRPDLVIRMYTWNLGNYPLGKRLRRRMAPRPWMATFYRVGGIIFMCLGVAVGTLAAVGIIRAE
ncbi:hypothetical protein SAMN05216554_4480 [Herbiconiux ginsengi]|uniref:Uncharacterized protein n=1 Tax=Herbiconiux ginsengi TaxID=381665 RepID=A0A1H3TT08_9MICO|nr:hypothetical protein SAMN05216554_4480 [Herbiconiux ginsengi]